MLLTDVARALKSAGVSYAVVGGYAVALHGVVRGTVDLDLILKLTEREFVEAEKTLRGLGLESRLPVTATEVFRFREEYIRNRNLIAWSFFDPRKPGNQVDIVITEDLRRTEVETMKIHGVSVRVISRNALIRMKRASGRAQDLEDVRALERLNDEK